MRSIKFVLLAAVLLIPLVLQAAEVSGDLPGKFIVFSGETVPGIRTQANLHWEYEGPTANVQFHLTRGELGVSPTAVLESTIRDYNDRIEPGADANYTIQAFRADELIAERTMALPKTLSGGFAGFTAVDAPYDGGGAVDITWEMGAEIKDPGLVSIFRTGQGEGKWNLVTAVPFLDGEYTDSGLDHEKTYNYMLRVKNEGVIYESRPITNVATHGAWFDMRKINLLLIALFVLSAVVWYVMRSNKMHFIRKIAGLEAVEEAVGRATEMGRSVLFVPGILDLDDVQTLAGLNILGSVAKLTAEYETGLDVPVSRSLVMSNGREVVKEAYLSVGRPDFYHDDMVHYVTDEQFGYVAAVDGMMVREEPAACFYMGAFFAESLILAETGNSIGAIQIAGTAMPSQLPFFVAACDYTLIGEELFAASAYLSGDQRMIASLRGQDVGKRFAMFAILFGSILTTLASIGGGGGFIEKASDIFQRLFALNY